MKGSIRFYLASLTALLAWLISFNYKLIISTAINIKVFAVKQPKDFIVLLVALFLIQILFTGFSTDVNTENNINWLFKIGIITLFFNPLTYILLVIIGLSYLLFQVLNKFNTYLDKEL